MPERAHPDDPIWSTKLGLFPTPALKYLHRRYSFCRRHIAGKRVLDAPCGTGMGAPFLASAASVTGLDYSDEALGVARARYSSRYSRLDQGDLAALPYEPASFDVVLCLEGIEHVQRSSGCAFLAQAHRVLVPNGLLIVSCPVGGHGIHSGNEFHWYEWGLQELRAAVGSGFAIEDSLVLAGPQGEVQILVGRRLPEFKSFPAPSDELAGAIGRLDAWSQTTRRTGGRAAYTASGEEGLLPTCFSILVNEALGNLSSMAPAERQALKSYLLAQQDAKTGMFAADQVKPEDLSWGTCDISYVRHQIGYFAISALDSLDPEHPHRLPFAEAFLDPQYALGWLEGGPWHDPWNHSNRVMFVLRYLIAQRASHPAEAWKVFDRILDYLDDLQSRTTGLWHGPANAPVRDAVFAAYHFYPFYLWRGRRPGFIDPAIDATLSIQHPDGLYGSAPGGGACEDLDAIDVLVKLSYLSEHRWKDVDSSLRRSYFRILQIQNPDGGFPNYGNPPVTPTWKRALARRLGLEARLCRPLPPPPVAYYSGWKKVSGRRGESDQWGAWFRLLSLMEIAERLPDLGPAPSRGRYHPFPALGWHDRDKVLALRK